MKEDNSKTKSGQKVTPISKKLLTREMRKILERNAGDEAQARKELSALLTKYKRAS
jgi:hypothetical protein